MKDLRFYGESPFSVVVVHGGPGARGEMTPVTRELANEWGVLEPLQSALSIEGQILELQTVLQAHAKLPAIVIGFSWGAWLSLLLAAHHPTLVRKVILVSSGPFESVYAETIHDTRLNRLDIAKKDEVRCLVETLSRAAANEMNTLVARFGALMAEADAYRPLSLDSGALDIHYEAYQHIWPEADQLRRSGKLLELAGRVTCPVVAIHGDYDPHPAEGVRGPLAAAIKDFRFILLDHCGHVPWNEAEARDAFYAILRDELR